MKLKITRLSTTLRRSLTARHLRQLLLLFALNLLFLINAATLMAGTATLTWDPPTTNADGSPLTDLAGYKIYYGASPGSYSQVTDVGNVTTYTFGSLMDGTNYFFAVTAYDSSGNESDYSNEVMKTTAAGADVTPPTGTVTINSGAAYAASASVSLTISATDASGVSQMCVSNTASCTTWESYAISRSWTLLSGDGTRTAYIWFRDSIGNTNSTPYSDSIIVDSTAPTGSISINSGAASTNGINVTLTISATDTSGVAQMQFSNDNTIWSTADAYAATKAWALTSGDGNKTVYVRFRDNAGNWSTTYSDGITLDTAAPVTTATPAQGLYNSAQNVTLTPNQTSTIYFTTNGSNPTTASPVYAGPISMNATATLKYFARDGAGNSEAVKTSVYTIDSTAPTGSMSINLGAASTNSASVTLTISATDANGVAQMQFSNDNSTWSAAEAYAATKAWTLTSGDGNKTVYSRFRDNAGNWSAAFSDTISLVTGTPTTTASPASGTFNSSQTVALTANKTATIYFTTNGTNPTTSSTVYTTPISISSTTTLNFFAVDTAGNIEPVKTETYTIDSTNPVFSSTSPVSGSFINTLTVGYTLSETVASGKVIFTRTGGATDSSTHLYNFTNSDMTAGTHNINMGISLTNGAVYTVSFDATDLAGNPAATVSNTGIIYDAAGASVSISSPLSNSLINNAIVTYNLSKDISGGELVFTRTGGNQDSLSPHIYVLGTGDKTAGVHIVTTSIDLANGATYSVEIRNVADMAGNLSATVLNTNVTFDTAAITITETTPIQGEIITAPTIQYSFNEAASFGKVSFTRTGGNPDANSPHAYDLSSSDLYAGNHTVAPNVKLVDGTFYTISFDARDMAGNPATAVSNAMVFYDGKYVSLPVGNIDNTDQSVSRVDGSDLIKLSVAFGSRAGDSNWNPVCDLNRNSQIDGDDLIMFGTHFGEVAQ